MICENALLKEVENGHWDIDISQLKQILERCPKEEIVRCKDCKYCHDIGGEYLRCYHPDLDFEIECADHWLNRWPDEFCSSGERRQIKNI